MPQYLPGQEVSNLEPSTLASRLLKAREVLALWPRDVSTRCVVAELLEAGGQVQEALTEWTMALSVDPNTLQAWVGVARCRRRLAATPGEKP
jgi:cytochrome c-type biogenesis protein CcmH/NrfG